MGGLVTRVAELHELCAAIGDERALAKVGLR
jgi:hypothetical protein